VHFCENIVHGVIYFTEKMGRRSLKILYPPTAHDIPYSADFRGRFIPERRYKTAPYRKLKF